MDGQDSNSAWVVRGAVVRAKTRKQKLVPPRSTVQPSDLLATQVQNGKEEVYLDERNPRKATSRRDPARDAEHHRQLAETARLQGKLDVARRQLDLASEAERRLSDSPGSRAKIRRAQRKAELDAKAAATAARRARDRDRASRRNDAAGEKST